MASSPPSSSNEYTQEQLEAVRRIKRCKNHYELLGVSKEFTESELKKQYRKLALQFHPDKNKAPGASEAFKAISNAFVVLSDSEKRRQYDLYGPEGGSNRSHNSSRSRTGDGGYFDYHRGFDSDVSPEELFNMFFGNMNGSHGRSNGYTNSVNNHHSNAFFDPLRTFDIFNAGFDSPFGPFANSSSHNQAGKTGVKRTQTSTRFVNGKKIETKKVIENGVETVTVIEDGMLKSRTVNGVPQAVNY